MDEMALFSNETSEVPFFPDEEYEARLRNLRQLMTQQNLDACLISAPENIYYLSGLSHQGFFAFHLLIVPLEGESCLIARAMERPTVEAQVTNARFTGFDDGDDPVHITCEVLTEMGLGAGRLGVEKNNLFHLSPRIPGGIVASLPEAEWTDVSDLVDGLRVIKSPLEQAYTRQAAAVSDAMMRAAIETARPGVNEREVAAEVYRTMVLQGGEYPGFGPFIRSTPKLGREHETWSDRVLSPGDALFLELSGCVRRYHAPMGRLIFIGKAPPGTRETEQICLEAFDHIVAAVRPGAKASEVYQAWQNCVDQAGLAHYRRHHCGYTVGIAFPPSWVGGNAVVGLRHDNTMILRSGMVFHLMSWLMGTGRGEYFVSDTALLTENGCERLTTGVSQHLHEALGQFPWDAEES
ncbi:MAG: M24 family metallopeptidase [Anaerolineae bacterium]